MNNRIKRLGVLFSFILIFGMAFSEDCTQLGEDCVATAEENYENGTYNESERYLFVHSLCPNAALNCVLDQA